MSEVANNLRRRSEQHAAASAPLIDEADFDTNQKKQCLFIIGQTVSHILDAMADVLQVSEIQTTTNGLTEQRRRILERNEAIRAAAARGDWVEFNRLTEQ